jgi:hypothetical protein
VRTSSETKSIVQTQRRFQREFDVPRHDRIPLRDVISKWVADFNVRGSVMSKSVGPAHSVHTPENGE